MDKNTATKKALDYLAVLLQDAGFTTLAQRNAYLARVTGHDIRFLDELTSGQVSGLITQLEAKKESVDGSGKSGGDQDDD